MEESKKIKVLNIITLFSVGGATETVVSMAEGLNKKGYEVHIATGPNIPAEGSMYETAGRLNIPVFTFENLQRAINIVDDVRIILELARFIRKNNYDIVHTHSSKAGVVGRLAAWLAGTKVRLHTIHGLPFHRYESFFVRNSFKLIEKFAALTCTKLVAVTHTIVDVMVKNHLASREKFAVIRSGFNIDEYINFNKDVSALRKKFGLNEDDIVIGKVSRFSILKGHKYLINAFGEISKKNPKTKLLLIGNGEIETSLREMVKQMNLSDRVIFTGLIPPEEIPSAIAVLDILVHSSLLEGLARVLPQAIMMEKPVISFDLDGAHEVIKDCVNGYLIEPENEKMLSDRILDLAENLDKAKEFGKIGKQNLKDEFSTQRMVNQIHELYTSLLR